MKLKTVNENQLEFQQGPAAQLVGAIAFIIFGLGAVVVGLRTEDSSIWVIVIGAIFALIGAFIIFRATKTEVTLRNNGVSVKKITTILTKKSLSEEFNSDQVEKVVLESSVRLVRDSDGDSRRERTSILYVNLNDSRQVVLATKSSSGGFSVNNIDLSSFGSAPLSKEAEQMATFFNVPLENLNNGAPSVGEIIKGVKEGINQARAGAESAPEEKN